MEQLIELGKFGIIAYFTLVVIGFGIFIWFANKLFK